MRFTSASLALAVLLVDNAFATVLPQAKGKKRALQLHDALAGAQKGRATPTSSVAAVVPVVAPSPVASPLAEKASSNTASAGAVDVSSTLTKLGFKNLGQNSVSNNGQCWLGSDGPNTNVVKNSASGPIVVVVWGAVGSWMTDAAKPPLITVSLAPGQSQTISCADISGGMSALYSDTTLSPYGQVDNTWVEFTYGSWGTVNVSREVRMDGNPVSVVGSKCTTNMNTCVFTCKSGNTCGDVNTYQINNCGPQNNGQASADGMNGGCLMGANAQLTTTFS